MAKETLPEAYCERQVRKIRLYLKNGALGLLLGEFLENREGVGHNWK